jgi:hypothetical protein
MRKKFLKNRERSRKFLKRADRDPESTHAFNPASSDFLLIDPCEAYKFEEDLAGAKAAAASGGPKCYGETPAGSGKRAFAMEKVETGFTTIAPTGKETAAELIAIEKEAKFFASKVTPQTVNGMDAYSARLLKNGHYYDGEVQGIVDAQGRWRPIDFQATVGCRQIHPAPGTRRRSRRTRLTSKNYVAPVREAGRRERGQGTLERRRP